MPDMEKVIKGLECQLNDEIGCPDVDCPYFCKMFCNQVLLLRDALSLLKRRNPG